VFRVYPNHRTVERPAIFLNHSRDDKDVVRLRDGFHLGHGGARDRDCGFGVREKVVSAGGITFADGAAECKAFRVPANAVTVLVSDARRGREDEKRTMLPGTRRVAIHLVPLRF
jgi:hypothetical protein